MNGGHETNPEDSFVFLTKTELFLSQTLIVVPSLRLSNQNSIAHPQPLTLTQTRLSFAPHLLAVSHISLTTLPKKSANLWFQRENRVKVSPSAVTTAPVKLKSTSFASSNPGFLILGFRVFPLIFFRPSPLPSSPLTFYILQLRFQFGLW